MDTGTREEVEAQEYGLRIAEDARDDTVAKIAHGHAVHTPIDRKREIDEEEICKEITERAKHGEHFPASHA